MDTENSRATESPAGGGSAPGQGDAMSADGPGGANPRDDSPRRQRAEEVFARLFGPRDASAPDADPELGEILRRMIFGDVFAIGALEDTTRELITCTVLAAQQALPQLRAHAGAALRVGVEPVALREAIYQLAPFIGFPRTLNAVGILDEVLRAAGHALPLPDQGTITDAERHERGLAAQVPLYGTEIADGLTALPAPFAEAVSGLLTDHLFGDFWTRGGLDVATRELLGLVTLTALGLAPQLPAHVRGTLAAGNSVETILAALVQALPYTGTPYAINTIRVVMHEIGEPAPDQA